MLTLYMLSLTGDRLTDYYVSLKNVPGPEQGRRLFAAKKCLTCHSLGGQGGQVGPALDGVGERRDAAWIREHLRNPQAVTPESSMPRFDFTEHEIRALSEFLLQQTGSGRAAVLDLSAQLTPAERGRVIYAKYGCNGCHGPAGRGGVPNPNAKSDQQVPGLTHLAEMVEFIGLETAKAEAKALGPGSCPICGMALEPREVTEEDAVNPELADMRRRFVVSTVLTVPLVVIAMGDLIPEIGRAHV